MKEKGDFFSKLLAKRVDFVYMGSIDEEREKKENNTSQ